MARGKKNTGGSDDSTIAQFKNEIRRTSLEAAVTHNGHRGSGELEGVKVQ